MYTHTILPGLWVLPWLSLGWMVGWMECKDESLPHFDDGLQRELQFLELFLWWNFPLKNFTLDQREIHHGLRHISYYAFTFHLNTLPQSSTLHSLQFCVSTKTFQFQESQPNRPTLSARHASIVLVSSPSSVMNKVSIPHRQLLIRSSQVPHHFTRMHSLVSLSRTSNLVAVIFLLPNYLHMSSIACVWRD